MKGKLWTKGFRIFLLIWSWQVISLIGSGLTGFALGVWVFMRTGSVTQFALISVFTSLPGIVFSPIAGALVDRWDRRKAMLLSDLGAGACTLSIVLLLAFDQLETWHIYLIMAISSTFSAFQWPAYSAATSLLVPKEQYGRASGIVQMGEAVAQIAAPVTAVALVGTIGLQGIIFIDQATMLYAIATLLFIRIPAPPKTTPETGERRSLLREASFGWKYITARHGLLALLLLFTISNFTTSMVQVLFTPLILGFSTPAVLGMMVSIGGAGLLGGSLLMSVWGGPKHRIYGILVCEVVVALVLFGLGFPLPVAAMAPLIFIGFFSLPVTNGCSQAIWMSKTAPDIQGRVFATRRMIAWSTMPLSYLLAGPLADRVFVPLLVEGGPLAPSLGRIIGVGPARGVGLLFMVLGIISLLGTLVALAYPRLRKVELELPDVVINPQ